MKQSPEQDTVSAETPDSLSTAATTIGKVCSASFAVSTVSVGDTPDLFRLSVMLGQGDRAAAALARWLAAPQTLADRGETVPETQAKRLDQAIHVYLQEAQWRVGLPARVAAAQVNALLQRLDALGPTLRIPQLDAHSAVAIWDLQEADDRGQWDPAQTIQIVNEWLRRMDAATPQERRNMLVKSGLEVLFARMRMCVYLVAAQGFVNPHGTARFVDSLRKASPTFAEITTYKMYEVMVRDLSQTDSVVPSLTGDFWYNVNSVATWPRPGRLSLLIAIESPQGEDISRNSLFWSARRLLAKYGARGLDVTLVLKTNGYWLKSGTQTGPIPPAQEAAADSAYILGHLQLPFTLVVAKAPYVFAADGHVVQSAPVQFESAYGPLDQMRVVLSDRTGHLVFTANSWVSETRLEAYIKRALGP